MQDDASTTDAVRTSFPNRSGLPGARPSHAPRSRQWLLWGWIAAILLVHARADEEQDLIAVLRSTAGAPQKWSACQRLRSVGTRQCVPALGALLIDERLSQAARHALEILPYPEAGEALREGLRQTSGLLRAGAIDSLGWRGEAESVLPLKPLLLDRDPVVATAAAVALGRVGGPDALAALNAARGQALEAAQPAMHEALLKCAERLAAQDPAGAVPVFRSLTDRAYPAPIRSAAWRGLALSDRTHRVELVLAALSGSDRAIQTAAHQVIREASDRQLIEACRQRWNGLPPESQQAVLDAHVPFGVEALPTARAAAQSSDLALRTAAWRALGDLNDASSVDVLAKAATASDPAERDTARDSLARLRGPAAREALLARVETSGPQELAELLRALGERSDRGAIEVLLRSASADGGPAREAALESLARLAPPEAIAPLLDVAVKSATDQQREPVLKALYAVCEASPDKDQAARNVIVAMGRFPGTERRQILPLLAELGTADALAAAQAASRSADVELAKEAVRVLGRWPNASPAEPLLELARTTSDPTLQTLAWRGSIEVTGLEPDPAKRLRILEQALREAKRPEEKKQALGQVGQIGTPPALALAREHLNDPELGAEAGLAAISAAEKLGPSNPKLADEVAAQVLEKVKEGDLARRAWALRLRPSGAESFIRDWMVAGPYRQAGLTGTTTVFGIPFGPEKAGQAVEWKSMPPADQANLAGFFPGQENCVAYLRTSVIAPQEAKAVLLMGSDDGIKAWLNGQVVHSTNVDRGQVVDQDAAPIQLRKGPNDLVLKVSQGGGGWSACARIISTDGKPFPGLMVERPPKDAPTELK